MADSIWAKEVEIKDSRFSAAWNDSIPEVVRETGRETLVLGACAGTDAAGGGARVATTTGGAGDGVAIITMVRGVGVTVAV